MTDPCPSSCGGGAGGGLSTDVLSATLFAVDFEDSVVSSLLAVVGKGVAGTVPLLLLSEAILFCRVEERIELLKGRVVGRLEPAVSGEGPCALV